FSQVGHFRTFPDTPTSGVISIALHLPTRPLPLSVRAALRESISVAPRGENRICCSPGRKKNFESVDFVNFRAALRVLRRLAPACIGRYNRDAHAEVVPGGSDMYQHLILSLEQRRLLSGAFASLSSRGTLSVAGTSKNDVIVIAATNAAVVAKLNNASLS